MSEQQLEPEQVSLRVGVLSVTLDAGGFGVLRINGKEVVFQSLRLSCYRGQKPTITLVPDTEPARYPQ